MEGSSGTAAPVIDEGFRRWYASCPCCLGESYPEVKSALDREAHETSSVGEGRED
jgi:phage terminase large subunit GpA-like protein